MITATHQLKRQWQFERPHRVRLFIDQIHINEAINLSEAKLFWKVANKFKETAQYQWVESREIELKCEIDDLSVDWFKQIRFFANLSEAEYADYCLRFFDHWNEAWK